MSASYFSPEVRLDRTSPVPLYHQIASPIKQAILSGQLPPGTRLEDELSMAKRLNVSRPTARRALQELGDHGLLVRRRGVGTQVAPSRVHRPATLSSLFEDIVAAGGVPSTKVLEYSTNPATPEVANKLEIDPGTDVTEIRRLRFRDGIPIAILYNLVPAKWAPSAADLEECGFYEALGRHGVVPYMAKQSIGARKATPNEARLLEEAPNAALLTMIRSAHDENGRVVEWGEHFYRASVYTMNLTVFAR